MSLEHIYYDWRKSNEHIYYDWRKSKDIYLYSTSISVEHVNMPRLLKSNYTMLNALDHTTFLGVRQMPKCTLGP